MSAIRYAIVAAIIAVFTALAVPAPAAAMTQSREMAAQSKHHMVPKHRVVHRTAHPKMKQGACRHRGHC